tara:strand:+ start:1697 stop:2650 length:954 start_codon:yes stop_codon:yes gene_type:complete
MSHLSQDKCGDALEALECLFRSNKFDNDDVVNVSAYLSQKGISTEKQTNEMILKHMLDEWGIGFDSVLSKDEKGIHTWVYDSIAFLTKNPCIIGFMLKHSDTNWRAVKRFDNHWEWQKNSMEWERIERHLIIEKIMKYNCPAYILWKQWMPIKRWVTQDRPFYIRSADTESNTRWEYEPTSCWLPQKMCYKGQDKAISKILKKWPSTCLISNAKQFIVLKPNMEGWNQEKVMEFDGLPVATVADRLADLTQTQIEAYVHKHPEKKREIMPHLAHALMSVATKFGIKISHKRISAFQMDEEDTELLRKYDEVLEETCI